MKWLFGIIITSVAVSFIFIATQNTMATQNVVNDSIESLEHINKSGNITELTFEKCKEDLIETKDHILNSNTISYLFQVLTILIISLGFYLLSKFQLKFEKINIHEKRIVQFLKDVELTTKVVNTTNTILALSANIDEEEPFSNLNIQNAFLLEDQLKNLSSLIFDSKLLVGSEQKEYCKSVISDIVKSKFEQINKSDDAEYFSPILDLIRDITNKLENLKTRNTAANTLYK